MAEHREAESVRRRDFIKRAAAAVAAGSVGPMALSASEPPVGPRPPLQEAQLFALQNAEPPALQFQAYPGGTGTLMERLWREHGDAMFRPTSIELEPWGGPVPTDEEDLAFLPVNRLAALIRDGRITSTELTEIYLARLRRYDPVLLCAVSILEGRAREEAQQADADLRAGTWRGPLHGIPYGVKDLFSVAGAPTAWGSADFAGRVIDEDAEVVGRLRQAGAVLIAKLATGEFALGDRWYRGQTKNPWNVSEGSSGSSAGPGSATAAGCVAFAIGTETRGSIVSPSRRTGLSALRPTFGRVSRYGGMVLSWSMDKTGPMCRSIEDCALVFNVIHGASERDPASLTTPFRFDRDLDLDTLRIGYTNDAPESFLQGLSSLGARLREMNPLPELALSQLDVEAAAAFDYHVAPNGFEPPPPPDDLSPADRRRATRFLNGRDVRGMDYVNGQRRRLMLMKQMAEAMEGFDMFVSGSGELTLTNDTGHPSVVVPYDFGVRNPEAASPTTMPLTTVIVGDLFADDKILGVAHAFQKSTDWHRRRPDLSRLG
ncbi:MAG: amidase [Gemmatimonadota bacterium]|nr:amidase [Gemmatimonadota bacterium]MDH3422994.1 amidase [Gemmatimonadota bacterium]